MNQDVNTCVRIDRDPVQIDRCKLLIGEMDSSISEFSRTLQLAGNAVRMKILLLLKDEGKLCVCDLSEILSMKIPAVSQHLRKLKDSRMVRSEREGTTIFYFLMEEFKLILNALYPFLVADVSYEENHLTD